MMKVEILGPGCKRCDQVYENTVSAASDLDMSNKIEVKKIKGVKYIAEMGVFVTPGFVIDGKVVSVGKVLSREEIKEKIEEKI